MEGSLRIFGLLLCALLLRAATQEDKLAQRVIQTNHAVVAEQRAHDKKHAHLAAKSDEADKALEAECQSQGKDKHMGFNQVDLKVGCVVWMGQPAPPPNTTTNR